MTVSELRDAGDAPGKPMAEVYFDLAMQESSARSDLEDALLTACGIDPDDTDTWPLSDISVDWYDTSFEFYNVRPGWMPTREQIAACYALGFDRFWLNYSDGTESSSGSKPRAVDRPRTNHESAKLRVRLSKALARIALFEGL